MPETDDLEPFDDSQHASDLCGSPSTPLRAALDKQSENDAKELSEHRINASREADGLKQSKGHHYQSPGHPDEHCYRHPESGLTLSQMAFLTAFRVCPSGPVAARRAGVSISAVNDWRGSSDAFKLAYADAFEAARGALFSSMWVSATEGDVKAVYQGGIRVGYERKFSDRMRELLAKAVMPEMFARKELAGASQTVNIKATPEQIAEVVRRLSPTARKVQEPIEAQAVKDHNPPPA